MNRLQKYWTGALAFLVLVLGGFLAVALWLGAQEGAGTFWIILLVNGGICTALLGVAGWNFRKVRRASGPGMGRTRPAAP